tara:strand:+ start:43 stop:420 length:378 start_codon:yes stop_codon:yes gene_type:complete
MSKYVADPNDSTKQVAGSLPDNAYDSAQVATSCTLMKTPNAVTFTQTPATDIGMFFGSSASFAALGGADGATGGANKSAAANYVNFGKPSAGTTINISPSAISGSVDDIGKVVLIYKSGLSGGGA